MRKNISIVFSALWLLSVFPRVITPNGDGVNDVVFFVFQNPGNTQAAGTIYDIRSAKVAEVVPGAYFLPNHLSFQWDGRDDSGAVVPAGVYLYKISVGGQSYTGTIGVAR